MGGPTHHESLFPFQLSGTLSTKIGNLEILQRLDLGNAYLEGPIPSEMGLLKNLLHLNLFGAIMDGTIPEELYTGLRKMTHLGISNNAFTGTISTNLGLWTNLFSFHIAKNQFHGTIPDSIILSNLVEFVVNGNRLTGTFPQAICNAIYQQGAWDIEVGIVSDCPSLDVPGDGDSPALVCPEDCCTECCDSELDVCYPQ